MCVNCHPSDTASTSGVNCQPSDTASTSGVNCHPSDTASTSGVNCQPSDTACTSVRIDTQQVYVQVALTTAMYDIQDYVNVVTLADT